MNMMTHGAVDCREASQKGAGALMCPAELVRGREAEFLGAALPMVERDGLVLDMSQVESIDAGGIGILMTLWQIAEREGNFLVLTNPSPRVHDVLSLVGLDSILICSGAAA